MERALIDAGIDFEFGRSLHDCAYEIALSIAEDELVRAQKLAVDAINESTDTLHSCVNSAQLAKTKVVSADLECKSIKIERNLAKLSVIGTQLSSSYEVEVMQALTKAGVPISMLITHDRQLSVMIPADIN